MQHMALNQRLIELYIEKPPYTDLQSLKEFYEATKSYSRPSMHKNLILFVTIWQYKHIHHHVIQTLKDVNYTESE